VGNRGSVPDGISANQLPILTLNASASHF